MSNQLAPHSEEAERAVLAAMLLDKEAIERVNASLDESSFYFEIHKQIFKACLSLYNSNKEVDIITVSQVLEDRGQLEKIGGREYLIRLLSIPVNCYNIQEYIDIAREKATYRELVNRAVDLYKQSLYQEVSIPDLIEEHEKVLQVINKTGQGTNFQALGRFFGEVINNLDKEHGIRTGYNLLDYYLEGLKEQELVIIGARPAIGKTSFALNLLLRIAKQKVPVAMLSLEMSNISLINRLLSIDSEVGIKQYRKLGEGTEKNRKYNKIYYSLNGLCLLPIYLNETCNITIEGLRKEVKGLIDRHGIKVLILDYLGLLNTPKHSQSQQRYVQVGEISRGLKNMAREFDISIIALHQLNRDIEGTGRAPRLSDLRESGSIEQDADVVLFLYPEAKEQKAGMIAVPQEDKASNIVTINLSIAKNRNGETGFMQLQFNKSISRMDEIVSEAWNG